MSDQEYDELEKLREEVIQNATEEFEQAHAKMIETIDQEKVTIQKKSSLLRKILRVEPKKPVTQADLDQLEMIAKKEELKTRIQKAKGSRPNIIEKVLGKSSYDPFRMTGKSHTKKGDLFG